MRIPTFEVSGLDMVLTSRTNGALVPMNSRSMSMCMEHTYCKEDMKCFSALSALAVQEMAKRR